MRKLLVYLLPIILSYGSVLEKPTEKFTDNPESVLQNISTWWNYHYRFIHLSQNFIPLDTAGLPISKASFLQQFSSGRYVAFKLNTTDDTIPKYQLYSIPFSADKNISIQAKEEGARAYNWYKREGTTLPGFNFTDLNGHFYNSASIKGKVVVVKCWFIHCQVCVEEIPALNKLVEQYKNRNDIVFISLAFDTKEQLQKFVHKTRLDYAVVPVTQDYLTNRLQVREYPTHIVLNKKGTIAKMSSDYHDILPVLQQELLQ